MRTMVRLFVFALAGPRRHESGVYNECKKTKTLIKNLSSACTVVKYAKAAVEKEK